VMGRSQRVKGVTCLDGCCLGSDRVMGSDGEEQAGHGSDVTGQVMIGEG